MMTVVIAGVGLFLAWALGVLLDGAGLYLSGRLFRIGGWSFRRALLIAAATAVFLLVANGVIVYLFSLTGLPLEIAVLPLGLVGLVASIGILWRMSRASLGRTLLIW